MKLFKKNKEKTRITFINNKSLLVSNFLKYADLAAFVVAIIILSINGPSSGLECSLSALFKIALPLVLIFVPWLIASSHIPQETARMMIDGANSGAGVFKLIGWVMLLASLFETIFFNNFCENIIWIK